MGKAARRKQTRFIDRSAAPEPLPALAVRARRLAGLDASALRGLEGVKVPTRRHPIFGDPATPGSFVGKTGFGGVLTGVDDHVCQVRLVADDAVVALLFPKRLSGMPCRALDFP